MSAPSVQVRLNVFIRGHVRVHVYNHVRNYVHDRVYVSVYVNNHVRGLVCILVRVDVRFHVRPEPVRPGPFFIISLNMNLPEISRPKLQNICRVFILALLLPGLPSSKP
jgi:hypothetical protein